MVALAVKETLMPAQIAPEGLIERFTDGVTFGITVMVNVLAVALAGDAQASEEAIVQLTISWSFRVLFE